MSVDRLIRACHYMNDADIASIRKAHAFANHHHSQQTRASGEPYVTHIEQVAIILALLQQQAITIQAGLLHDVLEDTACHAQELETSFGISVLNMVNGVTKLDRIHFPSNLDQQAENYRKLFLAMASDIRVIIIKLADRLHNMRTLHYLPLEKQRRIAKETMEVYGPLSHRLGMGHIRWELEDLAFSVLNRDEFQHIKSLIRERRDERENIVKTMCNHTTALLHTHNIPATIHGRPKHFYSIYKKLSDENQSFSQLFDLYGIRIITNTISDCYQVLGIVHQTYKPVDGRLKDYIALPKSNMYQSLHTTVIGPKGNRIEIQIRTKDMHTIAENGIAAHWCYKEKKAPPSSVDLSWLNQILAEKNQSAGHFIESLKLNLYHDDVFVFTPKGDSLNLPKGATVLDAAFKIHSHIGFHFKSAIINGRMVPIQTCLENGDQIEILTRNQAKPSLGWLDVATTRLAKSRIKAHFKKKDNELRTNLGESKLKKVCIKYGFIPNKKASLTEFLDRIQHTSNYNSHAAILLAIQSGDLTESTILNYCRNHTEAPPKPRPVSGNAASKPAISIDGETDIECHIAKCCRPLPGDDIIGYTTQGYGISIHHRQCNIMAKRPPENNDRFVIAKWIESSQSVYATDIMVSVIDRNGLLKDILECIGRFHVNISNARTTVYKNGHARLFLTCDIQSARQYAQITAAIMAFEDVLSID